MMASTIQFAFYDGKNNQQYTINADSCCPVNEKLNIRVRSLMSGNVGATVPGYLANDAVVS